MSRAPSRSVPLLMYLRQCHYLRYRLPATRYGSTRPPVVGAPGTWSPRAPRPVPRDTRHTVTPVTPASPNPNPTTRSSPNPPSFPPRRVQCYITYINGIFSSFSARPWLVWFQDTCAAWFWLVELSGFPCSVPVAYGLGHPTIWDTIL